MKTDTGINIATPTHGLQPLNNLGFPLCITRWLYRAVSVNTPAVALQPQRKHDGEGRAKGAAALNSLIGLSALRGSAARQEGGGPRPSPNQELVKVNGRNAASPTERSGLTEAPPPPPPPHPPPPLPLLSEKHHDTERQTHGRRLRGARCQKTKGKESERERTSNTNFETVSQLCSVFIPHSPLPLDVQILVYI